MNMDDKEIDEFIEDVIDPDITQADSIDENVDQHIGEMGYLWETVQKKFQDDNTCFKCKQLIINKEDPTRVMQVTQAGGTDKGVVAFVSLCNKCHDEELQKQIKDDVKEEKE